jgi:hypothetical protein
VSYTNSTRTERPIYRGLNRRTMAEIQGNVTQKGKQSWASGFVNARGDKGAIAGWTQELTMVLDVFKVRSFHFDWYLLTAPCQTELLINVYVVAERVERNWMCS